MALRKQFGRSTGIITMALGAPWFAGCDSEEKLDEIEQLTERSLAGGGNDIFELDGDKVDNVSLVGTDWNSILSNGTADFEVSQVIDPVNDTTVFSGGSKDIEDIPSWRHKSGSTPPKDNITQAYAAAYRAGGELIIYFGAERIANNGDAMLGFWFFQEDVTTVADGSFTGSHVTGDVLILANFSNGGSTATIQVLEWVGFGGDQQGGTLNLVLSANAICSSNQETVACAITNSSSIENSTIPEFQFFEGGVNITRLFGDQTPPCFASFIAETRSSASVTATLKDFVVGGFEACEPAIAVAADCTARLEGEEIVIDFEGEVCNPSEVGLTDIEVSTIPDSGPIVIGDLAAGLCVNFNGSLIPISTEDPTFSGSVVVTGTSVFGSVPIEATVEFECPLCPDCSP